MDRPEVALLIVEPEQIIAGYQLEIPPAVLPFPGWKDGDSVEELCAFVILEDPNIPLRYTIPAEA